MPIKKIFYFSFIIVTIVIINNLVHSIYSIWQKKDLIVKARLELAHEKKENVDLKKKLKLANDAQFIEQEARNKLFLAKPGEGIIVIPSGVLSASNASKFKFDRRSNWRKWWDVFF